MKMKTKKEFLSNYASNPKLAELTLKQGDVDWSDIVERPNDYYDASSGSVSGMIYYVDTVNFAKDNHLLILQALQEFEDEVGQLTNKPKLSYNSRTNEWENETQYFNWLSWFAWEYTMGEVIDYLYID